MVQSGATGSPAIAAALRGVDPRLTFSVRPMAADVARTIAEERLIAALATVFGALALLLATLGIYAVTAYSVARRVREIAIRVALGAGREAIVALVARHLAIRLAVGLAIGLGAGLWLSRFVTALLFGVHPFAPLTIVIVVATIAIAGSVAACPPVLRGLRVQPAPTLRRVD